MRKAAMLIVLFAAGCAKKEADLGPARNAITADGLLGEIKTLSSDEFEGRAPATKGEDLTVDYLTKQLREIGVAPGNPDGTFVQNVPVVGILSKPLAEITVKGRKLPMQSPTDFVAGSRRFVPEVTVKDSPVVFVGYGVAAPEYGWDDYKGVDVKGKTLLMLVNDPPVPDPKDSSKLDDKMFKGRAMTYYGRWTYKYEIASEKGAAAILIVHETGPAGYPFEVVQGSMGRENFEIQRSDRNMSRVPVEGWITYDKAKELCKASGQDLSQLKQAAIQKDFRPVPLDAKASFTVHNTLREVNSRNVVAKLEGSDTAHRDEYVVYSAHWDHLGRDTSLTGDQIYNGAIDNASGTAALLEIAKAYKKLSVVPRRSILFLFVTGEEKGLLGSKYYAENPLYPLRNTLANINIDGVNQWGRTKDFEIIGLGNSTLDDLTTEIASGQGRHIQGDSEPEKGYYYRSDHFEFAKQGVPALDTDKGVDYVDKPAGYGEKKRNEYTANDYHKVSDEVKPDWDLSGAVQDIQLLFEVGYRVAQGEKFPEWKAGTEFKAKRDAMMKQ